MNKSHIPIQVILLAACLTPTLLVADVLSSTTTNELIEPRNTYDTGTPSLLNMRVKTAVESGPCVTGDYTGCTLRDVLNDIDGSDDFKPEIKVHLTADDYPHDGSSSNAEMRQRGSTSRGAPQKSFRIKLDKGVDFWRGERRIQLIKSFWDFSRIRNKLSYDLFVDIPNLPSMRTQFVNFKVEDQGSIEDYGLYTQIEYFGKEYLERRGWHKDSRVYKAEDFYFRDDPALALDDEGKPLDEEAFEKIVEIKRGDDHRKFVNMLKDLNDSSLDFNSQVFDKYFNRDNYLSWFASNLLLDNYDTSFHNFYLYNPKGSQKFYFVPWDYDLSLGAVFDTNPSGRADAARWTQSHANWWGQKLHREFLRQPGNLDQLREAMDEIKDKFLTRDKLQQKADSYYDIVFPLVSTNPDIDTLYLGGTDPEKVAAYNRIFSSLAEKVSRNYNQFVEKIGDPMTFSLKTPTVSGNDSYRFSWSPSETLFGQTISYDLDISTTATFDTGTIIERRNGLQATNVTIPWNYSSGQYFYRVFARDANAPTRYWQVGFNKVILPNGNSAYGVVEFNATINNGGSDPVGNPDSVSISQNADAIDIDVLANDTGSGLLLVSSDPFSQKGGSVAVIGSKINYQPKRGFTGRDRLWYVLKDSSGRQSYGVVTIQVASAAAPVGNADSATIDQNAGLIINVLANDTGSGLALVSSNPFSEKEGNVSIVSNRINYQPKRDFTGTDRLWYVFQDSFGRKSFGAVTITVRDTSGAPPSGNNDNVSTALNTRLTIDVLNNDTGSELSITQSNPWSLKGGRVAIVNNRIVYTPKQGFSGEDKLWYVLKDSQGRTDSASATINVNSTTAFPVAISDNIVTTVGSAITFNALRNDTGAGLSITEVNDFSKRGGRVSIVNGQLRYTPKSGYSGLDSFWYAISDSLGRTNAAKVSVQVN